MWNAESLDHGSKVPGKDACALCRSPFLGLGGGGGGYRYPGQGGNATSLNGRSLWATEALLHCTEHGGFGGGAGGCGGGGGGGYSGAAAALD